MSTNNEFSVMVRQFEHMVKRWRWMGSPLFSELTRQAASDADLIALALRAPERQPGVTLLFAAVHWLVLKDPAVPLGRYFASVTDDPKTDLDAAFALFRAFCLERSIEIDTIMQTRTVQLTMAGRAAFVLPLIAYVAQLTGEPLSFIEIGCSAGLLTLFDQYNYDYGPAGRVGRAGQFAINSLRFVGTPPALGADVPRIQDRVGIDLNPVDATNRDERLWIEALIPPDMTHESRQMRAALDLRARTEIPLVKGDALAVVPRFLESMRRPICILAAHCLYQWPSEARAALDLELRQASRRQPLHLIRIDHPAALDPARATTNATADDLAPMEHEAIHVAYHNGEVRETLVARYDSYGRRATWLLSPS